MSTSEINEYVTASHALAYLAKSDQIPLINSMYTLIPTDCLVGKLPLPPR